MASTATIEAPKETLRDRLKDLFSKVKLPSSPALAAKILALADDPRTTVEQFADAIQVDVALSARLLKLANAAQWGQRTSVTSINKAVTLLGIGRVRTVALGFQLVGHLNRLNGCAFDMKQYWQQSVLRGCLAKEVAERAVPEMADEAFLIGLLQDCGILLLVQLLGQDYSKLYQDGHGKGQLSPTAFFKAEKEKFPYNHVEAATAMAEEWHLPDVICKPLGAHHEPTALAADAGPIDRLCAISFLVGSICFSADLKPDSSEPALLQYAQDAFTFTPDALADCFAKAGQGYTQIAQLLGESLPENLDVTELLGEANRKLTAAAGEAEVQVQAAHAERDAIKEEQVQLQSALGEYRERAGRDPLTGILNRGAMVEGAAKMLSNALTQNPQPLAAVFIDVDNFKKLNDRYGHQTGDEVLRAVANTLNKVVVNAGLVGRYGGEEFVILVSGLDDRGFHALGEKVVECVRSLPYQTLGLDAPVTCSAGAVQMSARECKSVEDLLKRADDLMYKAKKSGKDKVCFEEHAAPLGGESPGGTAPALVKPSAPKCPEDELKGFRRLAERLNKNASSRIVNQRKQMRKDMLAPCEISVLTRDKPPRVHSEKAFVRNISTGGIGLLTLRPLGRGDPVEVCLTKSPSDRLFVAGLVAFCCHIEDRVHEVGIQFMISGKQPIFSSQPAKAVSQFSWLAEAVRNQADRPGAAAETAGTAK